MSQTKMTINKDDAAPKTGGLRYNSGKPGYAYLLDFDCETVAGLLSLQPRLVMALSSIHTLFKQPIFNQASLKIAFYMLYALTPEDLRQGGFISLADGVNRVCVGGAVKYAPRNWQKGLSVRGCFDSAMRHLLKINNGVELDDESGEHHGYHVAWNILAADWTIHNKGEYWDDRAKHLKIEVGK